MKLLKCGGVTYAKIAVNCFLERKKWKMSKQKTAQQIAEEAILFKSKKYYTIEQMADTIEANSNALNKILNLPRLSIPKKIAEELEEYDIGEKGNYSLFSLSEEAREFYLTHNNIVTIYFASKALGVELVEVTDA